MSVVGSTIVTGITAVSSVHCYYVSTGLVSTRSSTVRLRCLKTKCLSCFVLSHLSSCMDPGTGQGGLGRWCACAGSGALACDGPTHVRGGVRTCEAHSCWIWWSELMVEVCVCGPHPFPLLLYKITIMGLLTSTNPPLL
jgi:hypothetical protein